MNTIKLPAAISRKLPRKPSAMLQAALNDFKKILVANRRTDKPKIKINMWSWVTPRCPNPPYRPDVDETPDPQEVCEVCLAGAFMVKTLKAPTATKDGNELWPGLYSERVRAKLEAINYLRVGNISEAFDRLGLEMPASLCRDDRLYQYLSWFPSDNNIVRMCVTPYYDDNPTPFIENMEQLIQVLKEHKC